MTNSHNKNIYETLGRDPIHPFPARMSPGIAWDAVGIFRRRRRGTLAQV